MGFGDPDLLDDGDGGGKAPRVSCSICLDIVTDNGDRSWAKLQCGHQFHLDCIGSAFNVKGSMQCPNCRKVEKGQWLYSNGSRPYAEFNIEDWINDEDLYDLGYSEMSFGVHWCPFSGLTRLPSSFDEGELPSTPYHDLLSQHGLLPEHTHVSSTSHPCPYVAYLGPFPPSSSNSSGSVSEGSNFNSHWSSQSAPSEIPTSYAFPSMDLHYHSWEQHSSLFPAASSRIAGLDQHSLPSMTQRAARNNSEIPTRSGPFGHPFVVGHGSNARAGSSAAASLIPPYPGSAARAQERAQALQAYFQHPPSGSQGIRTPVMPTTRRSNGHRNMSQSGPVASSSEQVNGFYYFPSSSSAGRNFSDAENPMTNRFPAWEREHFPSFPLLTQAERDRIWGPIHEFGGASDNAVRSSSFRQRHGSERMPSQHRS